MKPHRSSGQALLEYAIIILLVALVVIAVLALLGPRIAAMIQQIVDAFG